MFVPPGQTNNAVKFLRNNILCVGIKYSNKTCYTLSGNPKYIYNCLSEHLYTLTLPAETVAEDEQGSMWRCESITDASYRSPSVIFRISSKM